MQLRVSGIASEEVRKIRNGGSDANNQAAVKTVADGGRSPCRHCLGLVREGEPLLILSYRPFPQAQPYAETGPIFLHGEHCEHYEGTSLPGWFQFLDPALVRGYTEKDWIAYDTGDVVSGAELEARCREILANPEIAYVHIRSKFNCFQCRVERAGAGED